MYCYLFQIILIKTLENYISELFFRIFLSSNYYYFCPIASIIIKCLSIYIYIYIYIYDITANKL